MEYFKLIFENKSQISCFLHPSISTISCCRDKVSHISPTEEYAIVSYFDILGASVIILPYNSCNIALL